MNLTRANLNKQPLFKAKWQSTFTYELPGCAINPVVSTLTPGVIYSSVMPESVPKAELICWSNAVAEMLEISEPEVEDLDLLSGRFIPEGLSPYATRYGGHQFGHWAGQLGDGRAIILGSLKNSLGQSFEIQLKGAGPTPYSRRADGRAVLRSSLREYLCSEAMAFLRVPTTRALSCLSTGQGVVRDMFYDGHPEVEPGAITARVAESFLRFGHFQILAAHDEKELLVRLLNYFIDHHAPSFKQGTKYDYESWFHSLMLKTGDLVIDWMRVGFVHGVMNTDNMSLLGLTIDYGPYGWVENYDPLWTPNTTDFDRRRYCFGQQPSVAMWNLARLADSLRSVLGSESIIKDLFTSFQKSFEQKLIKMLRGKLGLLSATEADVLQLADQLQKCFLKTETDYTLFYRHLIQVREIVISKDHGDSMGESSGSKLDHQAFEILKAAFYEKPDQEQFSSWLSWIAEYRRLWQQELDQASGLGMMQQSNPYFILRNYLVQQALEQYLKQDDRMLRALESALRTPYKANEVTKPFFALQPKWAREKPGCAMLSCSS